jgi:hypothetical protein
MTKEALKLALEALVNTDSEPSSKSWKREIEALTAIKKALANEALEKMAENARELGLDYEPAQEPVGKFAKFTDGIWREVTDGSAGVPLYTTPPQRTWSGLTLDERIELAQDVDWAIGAYCEYAEKIEAKLKAKNVL